ncbi:uncharacterized protein [Nicotiana sylvestris]|uniref:uncharacterized protein n=1 Tax=Nicotiana sylvestris TaxID=4096 RepID=UPI00388C3A29
MPTEKDVKGVKNLKQKVWSLPKPVPHISKSFVKPGAEKPPTSSIPKPVVDVDEELIKRFHSLFEEVNMVEVGEGSSKANVQLVGPNVKLSNWEATPLPRSFGLSTDLVVHKLPTDPSFPPIKQKLRKFKTDMSVKIKEEITKQLTAKVIRVTRYPTWLANVVPVPKKDGKTTVCVDYCDLNKAIPKDDFPLPNIHILIDNCAKHEIGSFVDYYAGYHQILMDEEDAEKTAFITPWGIYYYRVDDEYEPLKTYFPNEEVMRVDEVDYDEKPGWKLFFDGAANMKGVGIGVVLISEAGQHYPVIAQLRFYCTNNMAEYEACILGLRSVEFRHIPRIHNEIADALATLASMLHHPDKAYVDPMHIQVHDQHAYCNVVEEEMDGEPWFHDIKEYIRSRVYPVMLQVHGDLIHSPPSELHSMYAPWPFVAWGMNVIGPIKPAASNGHRFILVAIDYFTKWVEAVTFKSVTKKAVVDFIYSHIICRFGIPKMIITDNAANLNSHLMKEGQENLLIHRDPPTKKAWFRGKKFCSESSKKRAWFRTLMDNEI